MHGRICVSRPSYIAHVLVIILKTLCTSKCLTTKRRMLISIKVKSRSQHGAYEVLCAAKCSQNMCKHKHDEQIWARFGTLGVHFKQIQTTEVGVCVKREQCLLGRSILRVSKDTQLEKSFKKLIKTNTNRPSLGQTLQLNRYFIFSPTPHRVCCQVNRLNYRVCDVRAVSGAYILTIFVTKDSDLRQRRF